jgi:hypothetical protein
MPKLFHVSHKYRLHTLEIRFLRERYGSTLARDFGPLALRGQRTPNERDQMFRVQR